MMVLVPVGEDTSEYLFRRDQSDLDGSFSFGQVEPGKYIVVAIDDGWTLRWSDMATLTPYLAHGEPVSVEAGKAEAVRLGMPVETQPR